VFLWMRGLTPVTQAHRLRVNASAAFRAAKNPSTCSTFIALPPLQPSRKSPRRSSSASVSGWFWVNTLMGFLDTLGNRFTIPSLPVALNCRAAGVAGDTGSVHTPTMTLKNAALLALIGTILMTALLVWNFVFAFLNVLRDLVPAVTLFSSFIYAFGCFTVAVFFYVFHRAQ
jgi:hypothetical protein